MPTYDFKSPRLFVDVPLASGKTVSLDRAQSHYVLTVLRKNKGQSLLLFNGKDGEWLAELEQEGRKKASLTLVQQTRPQPAASDLHLYFAPLKPARMEYLVQKAVEMGAGTLQPVITDYSQTRSVNPAKMQTYALEAAEQCGILSVPTLGELLPLDRAVALRRDPCLLVFCDEGLEEQNPLPHLQNPQGLPIDILIGPEGGFSPEERQFLSTLPHTVSIPLGPRILRADTACVAAMALVQATLGDWRTS